MSEGIKVASPHRLSSSCDEDWWLLMHICNEGKRERERIRKREKEREREEKSSHASNNWNRKAFLMLLCVAARIDNKSLKVQYFLLRCLLLPSLLACFVRIVFWWEASKREIRSSSCCGFSFSDKQDNSECERSCYSLVYGRKKGRKKKGEKKEKEREKEWKRERERDRDRERERERGRKRKIFSCVESAKKKSP